MVTSDLNLDDVSLKLCCGAEIDAMREGNELSHYISLSLYLSICLSREQVL